MNAPKLNNAAVPQFFEVRFGSIAPGLPLPCDIYLNVNNRPVLFRRRGDVLSADRMKGLSGHGIEKLFVPEEQRALYLKGIGDVIHDPDLDKTLKGKFLKESAFIHIHDLFTKKDILPAINDAKSLVEDMVQFVSADVAAVSSLMGLSAHDYYTYNHSVDVAVYAIVLAKRIFGENKEMLIMAGLGGLLHDIGKRQISWDLINKAGSLTPDEWAEIKRHPTYGKDLVKNLGALTEDTKKVVYQHHENFDGTGYPNGLQGEEIGKLSRVVAIADVFDALTTNRSYHKAISPTEALNTMYGMQPGKFDPGIFQSFNKNFDKKAPLALPKEFDPCIPQNLLKLKK